MRKFTVRPKMRVCASLESSDQISMNDLKQLVKAYRADSSDKVRMNDNYLKVTSYEDDFVQYFDLHRMLEQLNEILNRGDGVFVKSYDSLMDDPGLIFDYGEIGKYGVHHSSDIPDYKDFKQRCDAKYGFARKID